MGTVTGNCPRACDECGWEEAGGREGCRARFEEYLARDFSDARYFRSHRLLVDSYCLQHPDQYCRSAKSLAAHLVELCRVLEAGAGAAAGPDRLRRWLDGAREIDKPALPRWRGSTTIGDLPGDAEPGVWAAAVRAWAQATWAAYADLQPLARAWLAAASGR